MTTLKMMPEFMTDEAVGTGVEEVKETAEETPTGEKETPADLPAVTEKPLEEVKEDSGVSVEDLRLQLNEKARAVIQLEEQRQDLLKQVSELRGQRREIKREELNKVDLKLDELKDVHPDDVQVIEKILRSKGYVTKEETNRMYYDSVKNETLGTFLEKYPEYKPENDPHDLNWSKLQKEINYYRMPENPLGIKEILERAHKAVSGPVVSSERDIKVKQHQIQTAGVGAKGVQRSSSRATALDPVKREMLSRGGWSEEEIKKIEQNLT